VKKCMILLYCFIICLALAVPAFSAGFPTTLSYQGNLTDKAGVGITGSRTLVFSLYGIDTGGSASWSEQQAVTVTAGKFSAVLGNTVPLDVSVLGGDTWMGIAVLGEPEMTPRQKLTSVAYALRSMSSDTVTNGVYTTGSYADPAWINSLSAAKVTGKVSGANNADTVTNGVYTNGSYTDPAWITSLSAAKITGSISSTAGGVPTGVITMWSGSIATIPAGWALCDGTNGTPNLKDRFIVGAGNSYAVGGTGGSSTHTHLNNDHAHSTTSSGSHQHATGIGFDGAGILWISTNAGYGAKYGAIGANGAVLISQTLQRSSGATNDHLTSLSGDHTHSVTGSTDRNMDTRNHVPPYYALAYIMKL
jgi:hypothetical protein